MAFWGVEVKPGKPYTHSFEDAPGRIHLTQATLGHGSSTKKSTVQCQVGDKEPIYLCTLLPDRTESCPLNLEFEEEDEIVTFSIIGQRSVHLSGIYLGAGQDAEGDDYSDSYEDIEGADTDESTDYDTEEDEYDNDFIDDVDDDAHLFPPSPVPNSGVVIEEIVDDEKPTNSSKPKHAKKGEKNEEDNTDWQIVANSGTGVPVLESEDEDGFPISSPAKTKSNVQTTEVRAEKNADKKEIQEAKEDLTNLKRKVDHILQDGKPERTTEERKDLSLSSDEGDKVHEGTINSDKPDTKTGDTANEHDEKPNDDNDAQPANGDDSEKKKKKKKKKKTKTQDSEADATLSLNVTDKDRSSMEIEEKIESQASKTRTFPNGLVIEELAMGKPDGKRASPGKKVSVRYAGKLKKNGQIFDSNIGRAPFKFRLGIGQVIKGWDVGVNERDPNSGDGVGGGGCNLWDRN
ncbi:FKBP-type peptidyl-prolyl cis-trans isomerase domain [Dillenia turbinata]|uniref:peptidylprolyl isomerase n=1 Tax=Dillenia turbinata TaxID=194707 RepID=A0AAN8Z643_9MAGN